MIGVSERSLGTNEVVHIAQDLRRKMKNTVSVITVAYNAEKTIRKTIQSVYGQSYSEYEYIIIDGLSTDRTYDIVCEYDGDFAEKGIRYCHTSERDNGIYDAMNKALHYCRNEWIIYMNSDDTFYNGEVLSEIFSKDYAMDTSCIYGDTCNIKDGKKYFKKSYPIECLVYRGAFIHQALFVRNSVMKKYRFSTDYLIAGDMDLFIRMYAAGEKFFKINICVANYYMGGISQNNPEQVYKEWYEIWNNAGMMKQARLKRWWRMKILAKLKQSPLLWKIYFCVNRSDQ